MPEPDPALIIAARVMGTFLFALSACHHIRDRAGLEAVMEGYQLLPRRGVGFAAVLLMFLEASIAFSLASGFFLWVGAVAAVGLLGAFAAAITVNLLRGRSDIDCGCSWGSGGKGLSWMLVLRNVLLAGLLSIAMLKTQAVPNIVQWIDGVGAGIGAILAYYIAGELRALSQARQQMRRRRG